MAADYLYDCEIISWRDGDTLVADCDLGFRLTFRQAVRLYGCDAPELHGPTRKAGLAALAYAESLAPPGSAVLVQSYKPRPADRYGRWLARVTLPDGRDVSAELIRAGHAVPYDGGKRGTGP
jgi:endonuclease YncB( thermonuclease family)